MKTYTLNVKRLEYPYTDHERWGIIRATQYMNHHRAWVEVVFKSHAHVTWFRVANEDNIVEW